MGPTSGSTRPVVWFVNQYAGSPVHGMEFRHYELGRALRARGYEVVVISGTFSHLFSTPPVTTGTYAIREVGGLTYCWVKVPAYDQAASPRRVLNMLAFMARLYRLPLARLPAPSAIVISSPSPFALLPVERIRRRVGARLVFEVRDLWPLTLEELGGMSRHHPLVMVMRWLERRACRVADAVVSVLPAAGPYLESRGMERSKLAVIPNGIGPEALAASPGPPPGVVAAAVAGHQFTVGFIGTLGSANALETLIEAGRLLADEDVGLVIVGHGPEEGRLREIARGLPAVSLVGPIPKDSVPAALAAFDICYVGYRRSPLYRFGISPNKVFDYMAAGRPVILAASAANDPVGDAGCGLTVPPGDPEELARAIRSLRGLSAAERTRLGENGRRYVEEHHAYPSLAGQLALVIEGR